MMEEHYLIFTVIYDIIDKYTGEVIKENIDHDYFFWASHDNLDSNLIVAREVIEETGLAHWSLTHHEAELTYISEEVKPYY